MAAAHSVSLLSKGASAGHFIHTLIWILQRRLAVYKCEDLDISK